MTIIKQHTESFHVKVLSVIQDADEAFNPVMVIRDDVTGVVLAMEVTGHLLDKAKARAGKGARLQGHSIFDFDALKVLSFELEDIFEFDELPVDELFDQIRGKGWIFEKASC